MESKRQRKARGAFFTPPEIAKYLTDWALRSCGDTVLEPSCGEAGFLLAAGERLREMGAGAASWESLLHGVEIDQASASESRSRLKSAGFGGRILVGDFFEHDAGRRYDAVVGNPPFIRYQDFSGAARVRSLEAALAQGVRLSGLASSWAAFVVKSSLHTAPHGRLALVLPAELLSVNYARDVRRFLLQRFGRLRLILFEERIFPNVLEEVVLLLAEGSGGADCFEVHQTRNLQTLQTVEVARWMEHSPGADEKWMPALVERSALSAYRSLSDEHCEELGAWGRIYLGAVTGNNKYFAITSDDVRRHALGPRDRIRISPPGSRHLRGLQLTEREWKRLAQGGARCHLFYPRDEPSKAAGKYIDWGRETDVDQAYKCRVRQPWWRVPLVEPPDVLLTYMNHDRPRMVGNPAQLRILNSVYGLKLDQERRLIGRKLLPLASLNSVTLLGSEFVGRAYGGGLLKMEPREADRLPVPSLSRIRAAEQKLSKLQPQAEKALLRGEAAAVVEAVDAILFSDLREDVLTQLRSARERLFQRRKRRGKRGIDR